MTPGQYTSYRSERIIDLAGTCPVGSLQLGDKIKLTFEDEEWELEVTKLVPFTVATGAKWMDWQASGKAVSGI